MPQKEEITNKKLKSIYGASKLFSTNYLLELFKNLIIIILRLYLVYGPNQDINRWYL